MSIILRMNDLPSAASSLDIRRFFRGIRIPDGGVHIIGGPESSVFIAFNDDSAAAEAMKMNGQTLMNYPVRIGLSSRNEMKNLIKTLFECAIMQENSAMSMDDIVGHKERTSSPERSNSPSSSSRYLPGGPGQMLPLLPMNSSQSAGFHPGPSSMFEDFESQPQNQPPFSDNNNFPPGPPPPTAPFDWNEAGPSSSSNGQYRPSGPKTVPAPLISGPLPPPLPSSNATDSSRRLTVEVIGLPYDAGIQDIVGFFYPLCTEDDIKLVEDEHNYPTGVALVRFMNLSDMNRALDRNGELMGDRPIWIKPLHEAPVGNRSSNFGPPPPPPPPGMMPGGKGPPPPPPHGPGPFYGPPPDCRYDVPYDPNFPPGPPPVGPPPIQKPVVYMKGLPFECCKPHHISEFFHDLQIVNIEFETDKRGRLAGNAYVEFATMEDYDEACRNYHMRHMGTRYIEVLPVNTERVRSYCVHLKNIPNCTFEDVGDFLGSFNFVPARIHHNSKTKEAFAEFLSAKEQLKAVDTINGKFWDGDAVSVSRIPFQVMMKKMQRRPQNFFQGGGKNYD